MTSHIDSKVASIDDLVFHPVPSKPISVSRVVRVDRTHVFVDLAGRVYSTQVRDKCSYLRGFDFNETLQGCIKLGVLTPAAVKAHNDDIRALNEKRRLRSHSESFLEACKVLGVEPTEAQMKVLKGFTK